MASKSAARNASGLYSVKVCGKAYDAGVFNFKVKPVGMIKRGFGVQHKYELDLKTLRELVGLMTDIATPEDMSKADPAVAEAIYNDLDRFPGEAI